MLLLSLATVVFLVCFFVIPVSHLKEQFLSCVFKVLGGGRKTWKHLPCSGVTGPMPATHYSDLPSANGRSSTSPMIKTRMKAFECGSWHESTRTCRSSFVMIITQSFLSPYHAPGFSDLHTLAHPTKTPLGSCLPSLFAGCRDCIQPM